MDREDQPAPGAAPASRQIWRQLRDAVREGRHFFREELWDLDLKTLPRIRKFFVSLARIVGIVVRGMIQDRCGQQAGTLTYLTLLALVPVLAMMFSVSKGLGAQDVLMETMGLMREEAALVVAPDSRLAEAPEHFGEIAVTVFTAVERTNVRTLGSIGLVLLLWTVVRVMGKVENAFNAVWGVATPRPLARRFADYISILVVVPILVILASSTRAFLSSEMAVGLVRRHLGEFSVLYDRLLGWTAGGLITLAFVFLLMFMPNTRVRFFPAFAGGLVTGLCWYAAQTLYFMAQVGVTRYNAIYGTFAALPLFLVWLHMSWLIVLFGAEVSFAVQNHRTYRGEQDAARAGTATLEALALLILVDTARRFRAGDPPWRMEALADEHQVPVRLTGHVVRVLKEHGLLRELADVPGGYVPGRDPERVTPAEVERAFRGPVDVRIVRLLRESAPGLERAIAERRERCEAILADVPLARLADEAGGTNAERGTRNAEPGARSGARVEGDRRL